MAMTSSLGSLPTGTSSLPPPLNNMPASSLPPSFKSLQLSSGSSWIKLPLTRPLSIGGVPVDAGGNPQASVTKIGEPDQGHQLGNLNQLGSFQV